MCRRPEDVTVRRFERLRIAVAVAALVAMGCAPEPQHKPAGFEPVRVQIHAHAHIARCNTVHSLTVPESVLRRYAFAADPERAILSCSLQLDADVPINVPALISGTATALTGTSEQLSFKGILDEGMVSYVCIFDLTARSEIRFDIAFVDPTSGQRYDVKLRQTALPGRR